MRAILPLSMLLLALMSSACCSGGAISFDSSEAMVSDQAAEKRTLSVVGSAEVVVTPTQTGIRLRSLEPFAVFLGGEPMFRSQGNASVTRVRAKEMLVKFADDEDPATFTGYAFPNLVRTYRSETMIDGFWAENLVAVDEFPVP